MHEVGRVAGGRQSGCCAELQRRGGQGQPGGGGHAHPATITVTGLALVGRLERRAPSVEGTLARRGPVLVAPSVAIAPPVPPASLAVAVALAAVPGLSRRVHVHRTGQILALTPTDSTLHPPKLLKHLRHKGLRLCAGGPAVSVKE